MRAPCGHDDGGSAVVEFVLVGLLLSGLTLAVIQFGLAMYLRNVVHDAAVEGAYYAALADVHPQVGADRARSIIDRTVGEGFVTDARADEDVVQGQPVTSISVSVTMPLVGTLGIPGAWEVTAHAPTQLLDG